MAYQDLIRPLHNPEQEPEYEIIVNDPPKGFEKQQPTSFINHDALAVTQSQPEGFVQPATIPMAYVVNMALHI